MPSNLLKQIGNVAIDQAGQRIHLTVEAGRAAITLELAPSILQKLITDLTQIACSAAEQRTTGRAVPMETQTPAYFSDIPVSEIGIGMGDRRDLFLVLRLFDFDLSYKLETAHLKSIATSFQEMVKALDAGQGIVH